MSEKKNTNDNGTKVRLFGGSLMRLSIQLDEFIIREHTYTHSQVMKW